MNGSGQTANRRFRQLIVDTQAEESAADDDPVDETAVSPTVPLGAPSV
jgi:hypothetical protein